MKLTQLCVPCALHSYGLYLFKLSFQGIKKQRIYHLMYVLNTGIVHTTGASGLGVESAFKDSAEDGGAYDGPIEVRTGAGNDKLYYFLVQSGNYNALISKEAAVDVRKGQQVIVQIGVALVRLGVQHLEKVDKGAASRARAWASAVSSASWQTTT